MEEMGERGGRLGGCPRSGGSRLGVLQREKETTEASGGAWAYADTYYIHMRSLIIKYSGLGVLRREEDTRKHRYAEEEKRWFACFCRASRKRRKTGGSPVVVCSPVVEGCEPLRGPKKTHGNT